MASSQSLEHISSSEMKAALVSPSRKRTRDAAYHPYANGATANGTKNTHNGHTNGNGHAKAIITSDCNGNQNSGVQHMVSIEFFFSYWHMNDLNESRMTLRCTSNVHWEKLSVFLFRSLLEIVCKFAIQKKIDV